MDSHRSSRYGLLYNYDVRKLGWPAEVDVAWRNDQYCLVSFAFFKSTVWCLPDNFPLRRISDPPVCCHASPYPVGTPYSAFAAYVCSEAGALEEDCSWEQMLHTTHGSDLARSFRACDDAVYQRFNETETVLKAQVLRAGKKWNYVRPNWVRTHNASLRALAAIGNEDLRRVYDMKSFVQYAQSSNYASVGLPWTDFMIAGASIPYYPLKVSGGSLLHEMPSVWLASLRRHLHNNMVYALLTDPLTAHMVGVVGSEKRNVINIWGDFSAISGIRHANHPVWIANTNDPILKDMWHSIRRKSAYSSSDLVPMTQFWAAGERYCLASATWDCRALRVLQKKSFASSSQMGGNPPSTDVRLREKGQCRFGKGDTVYIIVLPSIHQTEFTYGCLKKGMAPAGKSASGIHDAAELRVNPALRGLFGCSKADDQNIFQNSLADEEMRRMYTPTGLTQEQGIAALTIVESKKTVASLWSLPGAGKSVVLGWLLDQWLRIKKKQGDESSLAVVVTGRNSHREQLRQTILRGVSEPCCYILENAADAALAETSDENTEHVFLHAARSKQVREQNCEGRAGLRLLDSMIDPIILRPWMLDIC